jgi:hypothetical protein
VESPGLCGSIGPGLEHQAAAGGEQQKLKTVVAKATKQHRPLAVNGEPQTQRKVRRGDAYGRPVARIYPSFEGMCVTRLFAIGNLTGIAGWPQVWL